MRNTCLFKNNGVIDHIEEVDSLEQSFTDDQLDQTKAWTFHTSSDLIIGDSFAYAVEKTIRRMGARDTLLITGRYQQKESNGFSLAFRRALQLKREIAQQLDSNRITIDVASVESSPTSEKDTFRAADFVLIKYKKPKTPVQHGQASYSGISMYFEKGGVVKRITSEELEAIRDFVVEMISNNKIITVIGHSNSLTGENANYELGRKRAWALKKVLWDMGLDPKRIITDSKGSQMPKNSQDPRALENERSDIYIGKY